MKKHTMQLSVLTVLLATVDQVIKIIISNYCMNTDFILIPNIMMFKPVHNTDMSWFGSLGIELFANPHFSIILNIALFVVGVSLYKYIVIDLNENGMLVQSLFLFLISGILCSTIDRVFWSGSLDYIRLEGFFTFDLKDCYISIFTILFIYSVIRYHKTSAWQRISMKGYLRSWRKHTGT